MDLVLKLRELRRFRGYSQEEVAEKSGVGAKTLSSFETGDRISGIKVTQLLQLLAVYDMSPAEFFGGGIERAVFAEMERLSPRQVEIFAGLRELPDLARARLEEEFLLQLRAASVISEPRLRAVR